MKVVTTSIKPTAIAPTLGVLLAGGLARRMGGGDKPMRSIGSRTLLERVIARVRPQCDAPEPDHRMRLATGGRDRKLGILLDQPPMQPDNEIARQERTVGGGAQHPRDVRPVGCGPVQRGEDAGERPREIGHVIGHDRQSERGKARGIAIGVEDQRAALRLQPRNDARQDRASADHAHRLVAAPHSAGQTAG